MQTRDDSLSDAQMSRTFTGALNIALAGDGLPAESATSDRTVLESGSERAGRRQRSGGRDEARFLRPEDPITATVQRIGSAVVLAVSGELDMASTPAFKSAISEALIGHPQAVVIDLSEVGFLGSAGVSTLVQACEKIGQHVQFAVVAGGARNGRTIDMLNLTDLLSVYDGLDDALKAVATS